MDRLGTAMWGSIALIAWTHVGYPAVAGLLAARRSPGSREGAGDETSPASGDATRGKSPDAAAREVSPESLPTVALVIAAHNEEAVIGARLENALALDYPRDRIEIVVSLDGCTDGTREIVERFDGVRVIDNARGGKVAAQNAAVRATQSDIVAFSDANSIWEPDALQRLIAHFAAPDVGYVCGRLQLVDPGTGRNIEGQYWRFELWLRAQESRLGSITAGNGAIYAVRRSAYVELPPENSHDIGLPFRLRRNGLRSLYEPSAVATEPAAPTTSAEWQRKVRMLSRSWYDVLLGGMLDPRGLPAGYFGALLTHRLLRYATGPLHVVVLAAALAGAQRDRGARAVVAGHGLWLALALAGSRGAPPRRASALAWYYLVVTAASLAGLMRMIRQGPQVTWSAAEGTR